MKLNSIAGFATAGLMLAALPATARDLPVLKSDLAKAVVVDNTGSTNTTGYKIYVLPTGKVLFTDGRDISASVPYNSSGLSKEQAKQLFKDLTAAMPLTSLPVRHGMRSASFGTRVFITYKGQRSPDLTFAADPRTAALKADIDTITKTLHIRNAPRHPLSPIVIHADR